MRNYTDCNFKYYETYLDFENNESFIDVTNYEKILRVIVLRNENKNDDKLKLGVITIDLESVKDYYTSEYKNMILDFANEYRESLRKIFNEKFSN